MKRGPTTFVLVLATVVLALSIALSLAAVLSTRSGLRVVGGTYGHLAAAAAIAADDIASRRDADAAATRKELERAGVRFSAGPPPASTVRVAPAVREVGRAVGEVLGNPSRVVVVQTPESQIWVRSAHDPKLWVVLHAASYRSEVIDSIILISLFAGVIALAIAGLAARVLTRPLERLSAHAGALLGGAPMDETLRGSAREVRQLAGAIGDAGAKLRGAASERELMLAGISHDLRTPLARLRLALELGDAGDPQRREAMVADLEELDASLEQCLAFVRDGRDEALRDCDVATIVGQLLALRARPEDWGLEGPTPLHATLRPTLLRRALGNLMDNAERHGAAPFLARLERVKLEREEPERAVREHEGGWLSLRVEDHGAGVPPDLLAQLGKPFVRGDHARTGIGVGLGLSIVARAAELHGGELLLRNGEHGGFIATLRIPDLQPRT
ncbi:MAG TPA: ATP-binding protein [Xanthomonadaceae bacterium]|jgi:two-component system osmolarity sensor histidine kinase EnvZ